MNPARLAMTALAALLLSVPLAAAEPAPADRPPKPPAAAPAASAAAEPPRGAPRTGEEALTEAARLLREEIERLPKRARGVPAPEEETVARVRLAMTALALDAPGEAALALEALGGPVRDERLELRRLALSGLAAWSGAGDKAGAERLFEELLNRAAAGRRLELRSPALVDRVTCYGRYDERAAKAVRPGETVMAYCEVLNFRDLPTPSGEHLAALDIALAFEEELVKADRRGAREVERRTVKELPDFDRVRHRTRSPLRDLHLVVRFRVPAELVPGRDYALRITVRDRGFGPAAPETPAKPEAKPGEARPPAAPDEAPSASALLAFRVER